MLILNADSLIALLSPYEIIECIKSGFIDHARGRYSVPDRRHIEHGELTYLLMPAIGQDFYCTKLVSVVPANAQVDKPIVSGIVTLNKMSNGETLAVMDAATVTSLRTSAVGAIGLEFMTDNTEATIGIIGCGVQGIWQTIFAASIRPIQRVYCFTRTKKKFINYKKNVLQRIPTLDLIWCDSSDEVVEKSPVIYACTTSHTPVFSNNEDLVRGKKFISVGSFRKDMQELPDVVYEQTNVLIIDAKTAIEEVGDVINILKKGILSSDQIIEMGRVLNGDEDLNPADCNVFKSVGMAAFDLAIATAYYEKARKVKIGVEVNI